MSGHLGGAGWPSGQHACLWIKRSEVRSLAETLCAAVIAVVETVTYKLFKFTFTVYHARHSDEMLN